MMKSLPFVAILATFPITTAMAADLPQNKNDAPPPVAVPVWGGFYAGLNAGGVWSNNSSTGVTTWNIYQPAGSADYAAATILTGPQPTSQARGFIGGGQIGYNWQNQFAGRDFVLGVETDIQGVAGSGGGGSRWSVNPNAGLSGGTTPGELVPLSLTSNIRGASHFNWLGTVRGRVGYLATPTLLIYGTGGLAYGGYSGSLQTFVFWKQQGGNDDFIQIGGRNQSKTTAGWTAGGGVEWMLRQNISAKVEYLYYDLGSDSGSFVNPFYGVNATLGRNGLESITSYSKRMTGNIVRAGINYHFNMAAAPVMSRF